MRKQGDLSEHFFFPSSHGFIVNLIILCREISVDLSDSELDKRRSEWKAPPLKARRGTLYKYIKSVSSAAKGCVTDE